MLRKSLFNILRVTTNKTVHCNRIQTAIHHENVQKAKGTIDKDEIAHFTKLANEWWDEEGIMKPLHAMNAMRIPFIRDGLKNNNKLHPDYMHTSKPLNKLNILDVGCGGGILCEPLARLGATVTGVDACKDLIECATIHAKNANLPNKITYIYGNIEDFSHQNKDKFDAVVTSECIEHVTTKEPFLQACVDTLKPDGSLFVTTLNKTKLSWLLGICMAENVLKIVPKGTHEWDKFISPEEVQKMLEHHNCYTRLVHGFTYNFLTNKWYWIPNTSINYSLHAIKSS